MRKLPAIALGCSLALGLSGCAGGLEDPDLTTGAVTGQVANAAAAGGYVYVLGAPQLTAPIGADGRFSLQEVPVGPQQLVVVAGYQGGGVSVTKAELAAVDVRPAMRQVVSRDAAAMPAAGRVVAAARAPFGTAPQGVSFTVVGSRWVDVAAPAGGQSMGDLPAGAWQVAARQAGFRSPQAATAQVPAGASVQVDVDLEVDDGEPERGCLSSGCADGLHCSAADGHCYPCVDLSQCNADDTACDPVSHTCIEGTDGAGSWCEGATSPLKCPGQVWVQTVASPALGYCSRSCTGSGDCPAGASCVGQVCQVPLQADPGASCAANLAAFGAPCTGDAVCQRALAGGRCLRTDDDHPGTCSAPCGSTQDCRDAGLGTAWTCQPVGSQGYCRRSSF